MIPIYWLFLFMCTAFELAKAEQPIPPVSVLMRNYAQVPNNVLVAARMEAERLLLPAGVRITWREVHAISVELDQYPSASDLPLPPVLMINLLSASMTAKLHRPPNEFGFVTESTIFIFVDRLERMRRNVYESTRSKLLGSILAHELGHVLIGPGAHSPNGVMRPHWNPADVIHAEQGTLVFLPQQIRRLRKSRTEPAAEIAAR